MTQMEERREDKRQKARFESEEEVEKQQIPHYNKRETINPQK